MFIIKLMECLKLCCKFSSIGRVNRRDGYTMFRPDEKKRAHLTEGIKLIALKMDPQNKNKNDDLAFISR